MSASDPLSRLNSHFSVSSCFEWKYVSYIYVHVIFGYAQRVFFVRARGGRT